MTVCKFDNGYLKNNLSSFVLRLFVTETKFQSFVDYQIILKLNTYLNLLVQ